jgi:hypothetical protein
VTGPIGVGGWPDRSPSLRDTKSLPQPGEFTIVSVRIAGSGAHLRMHKARSAIHARLGGQVRRAASGYRLRNVRQVHHLADTKSDTKRVPEVAMETRNCDNPECRRPLPPPEQVGRIRHYCSSRCRSASSRRRRAAPFAAAFARALQAAGWTPRQLTDALEPLDVLPQRGTLRQWERGTESPPRAQWATEALLAAEREIDLPTGSLIFHRDDSSPPEPDQAPANIVGRIRLIQAEIAAPGDGDVVVVSYSETMVVDQYGRLEYCDLELELVSLADGVRNWWHLYFHEPWRRVHCANGWDCQFDGLPIMEADDLNTAGFVAYKVRLNGEPLRRGERRTVHLRLVPNPLGPDDVRPVVTRFISIPTTVACRQLEMTLRFTRVAPDRLFRCEWAPDRVDGAPLHQEPEQRSPGQSVVSRKETNPKPAVYGFSWEWRGSER